MEILQHEVKREIRCTGTKSDRSDWQEFILYNHFLRVKKSNRTYEGLVLNQSELIDESEINAAISGGVLVDVTTPSELIDQLEQESALLALELVEAQIRIDQAEQEQAELLLHLVSEGVI